MVTTPYAEMTMGYTDMLLSFQTFLIPGSSFHISLLLLLLLLLLSFLYLMSRIVTWVILLLQYKLQGLFLRNQLHLFYAPITPKGY